MASFLDQVTGFTAYQQEMPVDALSSVGMYKENMFNQGIQQVQANVNELAALPIARTVGQNYMNQKIDQLKGTLSNSLSSDFSDQRLVTQIGGLTKQIGADPVVQHEVQNTLMMKSEDGRQKKASDDGKSSVENDSWYLNKRNKWLNSTDLNQSFDATYHPYIDENKKSFEVIKALGADSSIEQNPYVKNPDGSINYGKVAAAMTEQGVKGISADKIENAIRATLTPDDDMQFRISGWYQFQGYDKPALLNKFTQDYQNDIAHTQQQIEKLQQAKKLAGSDAVTANMIDGIIKQKQAMLGDNGSLNQRLQSQLEAVHNDNTEDGEMVKGHLYKEGFIKEMSNAFSWEDHYLKYLTNPVQEQNNWEKDYAIRQSGNIRGWDEFNESVKQHGIDNYYKDQELTLKKLELQNKVPVVPFITQRETPTNIPTPTTAMKDEASNSQQDYDNLLNKIAGNMSVDGKPMDLTMLKNQIAKYQNGDKSQIPVNVRDDVDAAIKSKNNADFIGNVIKKTEDDVKKEFHSTIFNTPTHVHYGGKTYTFSPSELSTFKSKRQVNSYSAGTGGASISINYSSPLTEKEKVLDIVMRGGNGNDQSANFLSGIFREIDKSNTDFNKKVDEKLAPLTARWNPYSINWDGVDEKTQVLIKGVNAAVLQRYQSGAGGAADFSSADKSELQDMLYGKTSKETTYRPVFQGGNGFLEATNGDKSVMMPMNPDETAQVKNYLHIPDYGLDIDHTVQMGGLTTNPTADPTKAYYNKGYFSPSNKITVTADIIGNSTNINMKYPQIHVLTPDGWHSFTLETPMDNAQIGQYLKNMNDAEIITQASKYLDKNVVDALKNNK